jgi:hypothetical protein
MCSSIGYPYHSIQNNDFISIRNENDSTRLKNNTGYAGRFHGNMIQLVGKSQLGKLGRHAIISFVNFNKAGFLTS